MQTLPHKLRKNASGEEAGEVTSSPRPEATPIREVFTRRVCITLVNYAALAFTSMAIAAILPVFLYTPVRLGGVGFSEAQVSLRPHCRCDLRLTDHYTTDRQGHVDSSYWSRLVPLGSVSASAKAARNDRSLPDCRAPISHSMCLLPAHKLYRWSRTPFR